MTVMTGLRPKDEIIGKGESVRICWETSQKIVNLMNESEPERVKAGIAERPMMGAAYPPSIDANALAVLTGVLTGLIDCSEPNCKPPMLAGTIKMLVTQVIGNDEVAAMFLLTIALQMNADLEQGNGALGLPTMDKMSVN